MSHARTRRAALRASWAHGGTPLAGSLCTGVLLALAPWSRAPAAGATLLSVAGIAKAALHLRRLARGDAQAGARILSEFIYGMAHVHERFVIVPNASQASALGKTAPVTALSACRTRT